jgi:transcriptional regulator GlxA family with amidase domain
MSSAKAAVESDKASAKLRNGFPICCILIDANLLCHLSGHPARSFCYLARLTLNRAIVLYVSDIQKNISDSLKARDVTDMQNIFPPPPPAPTIEPDLRVSFILAPRFTLVSFAGFIDCLRHAADEADFGRQIYCQWAVAAPNLEPIEASCGISITPNASFSEATDVDYLIVVGGQLPWSLDLPDETFDYLRAAHANGTKIISLCTGSFILGRAGLLRGKSCVIHVEHRAQFQRLFPDTRTQSDLIYLDDNGIITCPGGTSAIDLAFNLIENHCGKARAIKALTSLLVDRQRTSHHMPQRPFGYLTSCGNWRVEQAVTLMERNFSNPYSVAGLAERLNTSERELNRAFKKHAHEPPSAICRSMRLTHGHWLLINTTRTITQISLECGFSDGAHFSRWFRKTYGEPPNLFRARRQRVDEPMSSLQA